MGRMGRLATTLLVALGMLFAPFSFSQQRVEYGERRLLFDHEAHNGNGSTADVADINSDLLGDSIDLDTGELSFRHVDISIPGNSNLPVEFVRIINSDPDRPNFFGNPTSTRSRGLANWHADYDYILLHSIKSNGTAGCVSNTTVVDSSDEIYVTPRVNIAGKTELLLKTSGTNNSKIFGSEQPEYTTSSMWKIKQTKSMGRCTWSLTTTDGRKFEFGQVRIMDTKGGKKKHAMLITKVSDVHGNYVKYIYKGRENRLTEIKSNDDRKIRISFRADGTVDCVFSNGTPGLSGEIVWIYKFENISSGSRLKYLKTVNFDSKIKWEFNPLYGVYSHSSNSYARRCIFGQNARVKHSSGLVAEYKTKKIVNFVEAESPNGHIGTSHRAACLPPTDVYNNVGMYSNALKSGSISDGSSSYGKFSTFFTSAVIEKKYTFLDNTTAVWSVDYGEGDLFNANSSRYSMNKTVHKNQNSPKTVDITKPKIRTVTDPLGVKYVVKFGRSLNLFGAAATKVFLDGNRETRTGLYHLANDKFYFPATGRYLTPELPSALTLNKEDWVINKYVLAENNPINFSLNISNNEATRYIRDDIDTIHQVNRRPTLHHFFNHLD